MQIPSSLASIVSYWFPNLGDSEKKAQGGKTPDLCNLSLDQVLQIYKQRDICSVGAEEHDSSPQFIRELEQTSWQQKQLTSGIFNHIDSMATNMNRISGRLDRLEPEVQYLAISAFILFLLFIAYARHTNMAMQKKFSGDLEKKLEDMKGEYSKLIENLTKEIEDQKVRHSTLRDDLTKEIGDQKVGHSKLRDDLTEEIEDQKVGHSKLRDDLTKEIEDQKVEHSKLRDDLTKEIEDQKVGHSKLRDDLTKEIEDSKNMVSSQGKRLDQLDLKIQGTGSKTTQLEESLTKLTVNLKASQAELEKIENKLSTSSQSIKLIQSQAIGAEKTRVKGVDDLQSQIIELDKTVSEVYRILERSNLLIDMTLSPLGSRAGSWAGSQSGRSQSGSPERSIPIEKH